MSKNREETAVEYLGPCGRIISSSKSLYYGRYPDHRVFFNATLVIDGHFTWYGDLDLDDPETSEILTALATAVAVPVHVHPESPYRWKPPSRDEILKGNLSGVVQICSRNA